LVAAGFQIGSDGHSGSAVSYTTPPPAPALELAAAHH